MYLYHYCVLSMHLAYVTYAYSMYLSRYAGALIASSHTLQPSGTQHGRQEAR